MRVRCLVLVAAVVGIVGAVAAPASAGISGTVAFECSAVLDGWPAPVGSGHCGDTAIDPVGRVNSLALVTLSGIDATGVPYVVSGVGRFAASFDYTNGCVAGEPPLIGTANGTATVVGLTAVRGGVLYPAALEVPFSWSRVGTTAVFTIAGAELTIDGVSVAHGQLGYGHATFAPRSLGFCPGGGRVEALVTGQAAFAI